MNKLKTWESFFGGTYLGSDQVNTDSSIIRNNTQSDEYSNEYIDKVQILKSEIINLIEEKNFDSIKLEKIKSYIINL